MRPLAIAAVAFLWAATPVAQVSSAPPGAPAKVHVPASVIALSLSSRMNVASEMGGAFMSPSKCDADGNLYIRKYAADRPLLGPVVKIDPEGKRTALFDPVDFAQLELDRADAFTPAFDGGLYQIAQSGVVKPRIYVLHFSPDGSASSPIRLDADFEVYSFAAFPSGNLLVSGMQRDVQNRSDLGRTFTAVFSADGRMLTQLVFEKPAERSTSATKAAAKTAASAADPHKSAPTLDLAEAEAGADGNLYAMRSSTPALIYVISPAGKVLHTFRVNAPVSGATANTFHVSRNRLAVSFWKDDSQTLVIMDAQTGQRIATYSDPTGFGSSFACYAADEGLFTFLKLGEGNTLEVIRAEAR